MNSAAYWQKRNALLMYDRMEGAEAVSAEIAEVYLEAYQDIAKEMSSIFDTFVRKYKLTEADANMILGIMKDPGDIVGLETALLSIGTDEAMAMQAELAAPAYRARIKRLQALQSKIEGQVPSLYKQDNTKQRDWYKTLARDTYSHTIYDVQKQVGFQFSFAHIDNKLINAVMNSAWSGETYSERLWSNINGVASEVRKQLTLGLLTGKTERQMAKVIAERYAVGAFESRRLIRTESCHLSNEIQFKAYEECGADRYQYIATLDSKTDEECGALDRKIFYVKDKTPGVNCPPMHPFCRCTTRIYIDQDKRENLQRRARNPVTGKNELVPANMSYNEWAEANGLKKPTPKPATETKAKPKTTKKDNASPTVSTSKTGGDTKTTKQAKTATNSSPGAMKETKTTSSTQTTQKSNVSKIWTPKTEEQAVENYVDNGRAWRESVTNREADAVRDYGYNYLSAETNGYLRGDKSAYRKDQVDAIQSQIRQLDNAIEKGTVDKDMLLYRGVGKDYLGLDFDNPESLIGQTITDKGYMSTTGYKGIAEVYGRGVVLEIETPKDTRAAFVDLAKSAPDEFIRDYRMDGDPGNIEYLLGRNQQITFTGYEYRTDHNGRRYLTMRARLGKQ